MVGVPFEFSHFPRFLVYIGQEATGRFTVKTGGGDNGIIFLFYFWPSRCFIFCPVIPFFHGWELGQMLIHQEGVRCFLHPVPCSTEFHVPRLLLFHNFSAGGISALEHPAGRNFMSLLISYSSSFELVHIYVTYNDILLIVRSCSKLGQP